MVKTSGADLKCGDHLCKFNDDYVGQILHIARDGNGHDHLSRPKVRLTVSCIREVTLIEGDQLFPVFCDQKKVVHADDDSRAKEDAAVEQKIKDYLTRISTDGTLEKERRERASRILKVLNKKPRKCMSLPDVQYLKEIRCTVLADVSHAPTPSPAPAPNVKDDAAPVRIVSDPGDTSALKPLAGSEAACLFRLFQSLGIEKMPPDERKMWIKERMTKKPGEAESALAKLVPKKEDRALLIKFAQDAAVERDAAVSIAAAVDRTPKAGVPPLAPLSDSTPALAPAPAHVAPRAPAPAHAPVSDPSPRAAFVTPVPSADSLSPAEADAYAALLRVFVSSGIVPMRDYSGLILKLIDESVADEKCLKKSLHYDPELLSKIGMKAGQRSCLLRYLSGGVAAEREDADAAAAVVLKSFFEAAGVVPAKDYDKLALQLIDQGVADQCSLRDSLRSTPPAFDLEAVVTKQGQRIKITERLDLHLFATP